MFRFFAAFSLSAALLLAQKQGKQTQVNIQKTSMSRDQEVELGKQAAAEVERSMEIIHDPRIEQWLNQIGQSLAKTPQANAYPYYFKLVNEESINAFALPGGPMYVHTGLIKAASNEGEVAGVLAHEMSHVALRHGAAQMGKQQTWGTLFGALGAIGSAVLSQGGQCTMLCQAAQLGAGIGGGATLNKFSRGYERDADLNGARMMAAAGYNPIELARFFDKLLAEQGSASQASGLEKFLSDHPATGNRIEYVQADIAFYPKQAYTTSTGQFDRVHSLVKLIPPPKPRPAELLSMRQNPPSRAIPTGYKDLATKGFSIAYPQTWQVAQPQQGGSLYIVPQGGATQTQNNGVELITGAMLDYYVPENKNPVLDQTTNEFLKALEKGDANMRNDAPSRVTVGGKPALMTKLTTKTSQASDPAQTIYLYTVARESGLWYLVLAAPSSRISSLDSPFREIAQSVQFVEN